MCEPERCCLDQGDGHESKKEDNVSNGHPVNITSIIICIFYIDKVTVTSGSILHA